MRWVWTFILGLILAIPAVARAGEFDDLADEVRTAMAQRDLQGAKKKLADLKAAAKSDEEMVTAERLDSIYGYLYDYWTAVHKGGQSLQGADELVIGEFRFAVVEYDPDAGQLILRMEGENKKYTLFNMPTKVVMKLASQVLKEGAPQNDAYLGAFLAMDQRGSRAAAREAWDRAQKGGVDVKLLLPELGIPLPGGAGIQLPTLTAQTAALLRPQMWQIAAKGDKGWKRAALGKQGSQNSQGRLDIAAPAESGETWITFNRKLPASFGLRIYLTDVAKGQRFGLFNEKADEATDAYVALPAGTVKIEFARRDGKLICRINETDQTVTVVDEKGAKTNGILGFTLPAGVKATIAGCELAP